VARGVGAEHPKWLVLTMDDDAHAAYRRMLLEHRRWLKARLRAQVFDNDRLPGEQPDTVRKDICERRRIVNAKERALAGAMSGFLATFVLSGLRMSLNKLGLVHTTAPEQVIRRLVEIGLLEGLPLRVRQAVMVVAHFSYGTAVGTTFGMLRSKRGR
jgi:hypothetical protein